MIEVRLVHQLNDFRQTHPIQRVASGGHIWEYLRGGAGASSIGLLPGGAGNAENMFVIMGILEKDFRVLSITCPDSVTNTAEIERGITTIMDREGIPKAYLLGHSLGAMFAERVMLAAPDRVEGLIIANAAHYGRLRRRLVMLATSLLAYLPRGLVARQARAAFARLMKNTPDREFWIPYLTAEMERMSRGDLQNRSACMRDVIRGFPQRPADLGGWKGRVLILESDDETGFTKREKAALRRLYSNASVHVFHGAGHLSPLTRPSEFADAVSKFVGGS
jgi:pimeloyl-ACP methyl ester carboxylesterase